VSIRLGWVNSAAVRALAKNRVVLAETGEIAEDIARQVAEAAPRESGQAAASIHVEPSRDGEGFEVGPGPAGFYLRFHELGTSRMSARPFVRPLVDRFKNRR
jgi:HK97 gp10 family phage protein